MDKIELIVERDWLRERLAASEGRAKRLEDAAHAAWIDIGQWLQLARYQREQMDQNLGWCPTQAGIEASERTKAMISAALAEWAQEETPGGGPGGGGP